MPCIQPVGPEDALRISQVYVEKGKAGGQAIPFFEQMSVPPASFNAYMDLSGTLRGGARPPRVNGSRGVTLPIHGGVEGSGASALIAERGAVEAHTALTKEPGFEKFGEGIGPYLAGRSAFGTSQR